MHSSGGNPYEKNYTISYNINSIAVDMPWLDVYKRQGLTMVWLIGCLLMFVVSQTIPQLLAHVFANTKVAAALQDNIAQVERYTVILGAITLLLACLMMITAFFRKKILHKKDIA